MLDMIPDDAVRFRLSNLIINTAHDYIPCLVNLATTVLVALPAVPCP